MRRFALRSVIPFALALSCGACGASETPDPSPASATENPPGKPGTTIARDEFSAASAPSFLDRWAVEQQPGGTVTLTEGKLVISDTGGCTVWWRQKLSAPVVISFEATVTSASRVSDLNCFWMASDPARPDDLFATGHSRDGRFATYDALRTYYVGYGGNTNSTTRFRRYDGTGARPLLPEHDKSAPEFLLIPDKTYRITLVAAEGRTRYIRDGEAIFEYADPEPLTEGWFGFRTVHSRIEIDNFSVTVPPGNSASD